MGWQHSYILQTKKTYPYSVSLTLSVAAGYGVLPDPCCLLDTMLSSIQSEGTLVNQPVEIKLTFAWREINNPADQWKDKSIKEKPTLIFVFAFFWIKNKKWYMEFVFQFYTKQKSKIKFLITFFDIQYQKWKTKINSLFNFCFRVLKLKYENRIHINFSFLTKRKLKNENWLDFHILICCFGTANKKTSCIWFFSISAQNWKSNDTKSPYTYIIS